MLVQKAMVFGLGPHSFSCAVGQQGFDDLFAELKGHNAAEGFVWYRVGSGIGLFVRQAFGAKLLEVIGRLTGAVDWALRGKNVVDFFRQIRGRKAFGCRQPG